LREHDGNRDDRRDTREGSKHGEERQNKPHKSKAYQAEEEDGSMEDDPAESSEFSSEDEVEANSVQLISSDAPVASNTGRDYKLWHYTKSIYDLTLISPPPQYASTSDVLCL
jgi:hypothetical protein